MAKYDAVKDALQAKLDELVARASEIEVAIGTPGSSDWEENAIESEDDDVLLKVGDVTANDIAEIKLALNRIQTGHYGLCVSCGKAITKERLAALPYTTRCIDCA